MCIGLLSRADFWRFGLALLDLASKTKTLLVKRKSGQLFSHNSPLLRIVAVCGLAAPWYLAVELLAKVAVDFNAWYTIPGDVRELIDADISPFVFK